MIREIKISGIAKVDMPKPYEATTAEHFAKEKEKAIEKAKYFAYKDMVTHLTEQLEYLSRDEVKTVQTIPSNLYWMEGDDTVVTECTLLYKEDPEYDEEDEY